MRYRYIFILLLLLIKTNLFCQLKVKPENNHVNICSGDNASLSVLATGGCSSNNYHFLWSTGETISSIVVNPTEATKYHVTVTDDCGSYEIATILVSVYPRPKAYIGKDTSLCFPIDTLKLSAYGGIWCSKYYWNNGVEINTIKVKPNHTKVYSVIIINGDVCSSEASIKISVNNPPSMVEIIPYYNDRVCHKDTFKLKGKAEGTELKYKWGIGDYKTIKSIIPGEISDSLSFVANKIGESYYWMIATDKNSCTETQKSQIIVNPLPDVDFKYKTPVCVNLENIIEYSGKNNIDKSIFSWNFDSAIVTKDIGEKYKVTWSKYGYKKVTINLIDTTTKCKNSDTNTIYVKPMPEIDFYANKIDLCGDELVMFADSSKNVLKDATYKWLFGDGGTDKVRNPSHHYYIPDNYNVSLTIDNGDGCIDTREKPGYITVHPLPKADFNANPKSVGSDISNIDFFDVSSGNPIKFSWSLGDGDSSFTRFFSHIYKDTGTYNVFLKVTDIYGCQDSIDKYVKVFPVKLIYVPTAFSPYNRDGLNDVFKVYGERITTYQIVIYSRYGSKVYESNNIEEGWDGTLNGKKLPPDVYTYFIKYRDRDSAGKNLIGSITLLH